MNDVAALARVSIQTVSRAINRQPIVSPEIVYVVTPTLAARGSVEIPAP
jgi:DNA-binding LacI/PurR family transcriptional regulator